MVTGTLSGGFLEVDQPVEVLPGRHPGPGAHDPVAPDAVVPPGTGQPDRIEPGGADAKALGRGHSLGPLGAWRTTDKLLASLSYLPHLDHVPAGAGGLQVPRRVGRDRRDAEVPPGAGAGRGVRAGRDPARQTHSSRLLRPLHHQGLRQAADRRRRSRPGDPSRQVPGRCCGGSRPGPAYWPPTVRTMSWCFWTSRVSCPLTKSSSADGIAPEAAQDLQIC